jgi:hypothetical protein
MLHISALPVLTWGPPRKTPGADDRFHARLLSDVASALATF